jgi:hypothetical protein
MARSLAEWSVKTRWVTGPWRRLSIGALALSLRWGGWSGGVDWRGRETVGGTHVTQARREYRLRTAWRTQPLA